MSKFLECFVSSKIGDIFKFYLTNFLRYFTTEKYKWPFWRNPKLEQILVADAPTLTFTLFLDWSD